MQLRYYQNDAFQAFRETFASGVTRILYQGLTGSGKTVLFAFVCLNAVKLGNTVCILVHRRELLNQASRALTTLGIYHGIISPDHNPIEAMVQVASKDTLRNRGGAKFDLLIIDEAHHATARTYQRIIEQAEFVLGVTATPCRLTGTGLGTIFEELICGPQYSELCPEFLAPYVYYAPKCPIDFKRVRAIGGDYMKDELQRLMDQSHITGDIVKHYAKHLAGKPSICFTVSVQHAHHMAEIFRAHGYRAEAVDGAMKNFVRDAHIRSFSEGRLNVLLSCDLVNEGLDVPGAYGGIFARPSKSLVVVMQQWGRVLRPYEGKDAAIMLDHVGNCFRHGLPGQAREWSLEKGAIKPAKKVELQIRQCPSCYFVHTPSAVCPACGFKYMAKKKKQPRYKSGELEVVEEISREERIRLIRDAITLADYHKVGKQLGYKPGWAYNMAKRKGMR